MKICVICAGLPPFFGGAELRAFQHAKLLNQQPGVQCLLVGLHRYPKGIKIQPVFPDYVHGIRLRITPKSSAIAPGRMIALPLHIAEVAFRLGCLLFRLRKHYEVVHIFNPVTWFNLVPIPIGKALGKAVIVEMTLRGSDDPLKLSRQDGKARSQLFPHRPLKYSLFLMADAYVSKSDGITQAYQKAGLPPEKLTQIPSGVDVARFKPASVIEKSRLRKMIGLPEERVIILFLGGMEERKGAYRLLKAFQRLAANNPAAHLALVGPSERYDPAYRQRIESAIHRSGLEQHITFLPQLVENPEDFIRAADIFAMPSTREGFSMAILEAMACGLPVVASEIPEIAGCQITHGIHGLLTPLEDEVALSNALSELIENPSLRQEMGKAALERVEREFTQEKATRRYLDLYTHIMKEHI